MLQIESEIELIYENQNRRVKNEVQLLILHYEIRYHQVYLFNLSLPFYMLIHSRDIFYGLIGKYKEVGMPFRSSRNVKIIHS